MLLSYTRITGFTTAFLLAVAVAHASSRASLQPPAQLTCNHQTNPLAVAGPHPLLGWMLTASNPAERGVDQSAYRVLVSSSRKLLATGTGDLWDSGKVKSGKTLDVPYLGKALSPEERVYWKTEVWDEHGAASGWSRPSSFTTAPDHLSAHWIAAAPAHSAEGRAEGVTQPMPVFRTAFHLRKPVARALLYVSGLGQDEVHINGAKAGNHELAPGWTDYRKRILYDTYEVTPLLHAGQNAIGVMLGNGMFNVARTPGRFTKFAGSFGQPQCFVELHLLFRDGTQQTITSGPGWQTAPGPITFSSTYGGEDYDARRAPAAWDTHGSVNAAVWHPAIVVPGPGGKLTPEMTAPIQVEHVYRPIAHHRLPSGAIVYDLGQNFAGWPAITVRGAAGAQVKMIPGELLAADGSASQRSSGGGHRGEQWFTYTLRGGGVERWHPRFSYYGFRYVQVEITGDAHLISIVGDAVHSSAMPTGSFTSSDTLLNRIHTLILMAIENNMESILTDCPHREKLGWLEQTHLMGSALNFDFDLQRLYNKIENDMADEQAPNGRVPTIAPQYTVFGKPYSVFNDSPEWGSAAVLDPWIAYRRYGDLHALRAHYASMRGYVDYLTSRSQGGIVEYGLGDWYDIGPKAPGFSQLTTRALTSTAVYYQDILALAAAAHVLGDNAEQARMTALGETVRNAFEHRFYHPDQHYYDRDSQTANAMPLMLGLTPPQDRAAVLNHLIADIRAHNNHVTAGDVGFHYVVDALMENGASDILLDMMLRTDAPSYGYQLKRGATSLTEAWDANPHSSQDHFMLGDAEEWFYAGLGGIDVNMSRDAAHQIVLRPAMLARVHSATIAYRWTKGTISVAWKHLPTRTLLNVTVPPNATALIIFPAAGESSVKEGSTEAAHARGVTFVKMDGHSPVFRVQSGTYHFSIPAS